MKVKKLLSVFLASISLFATVHSAHAFEFKASGTLHIATQYIRNPEFGYSGHNGFGAVQRFRPKFTFIANENLYAVLGLEIGNSIWGVMSGGAGLGADAVNIEVKSAFLNWKIPGLTNFNVRMGIQPFKAPSYTFGTPVFDNDAAGIQLAYAITENVGLNVSWSRPFIPRSIVVDQNGQINGQNTYEYQNQAIDYFQFELPLTFKPISITPWGAVLNISSTATRLLSYTNVAASTINGIDEPTWDTAHSLRKGLINVNGTINQQSTAKAKNSIVWWAGIAMNITPIDNLSIGVDFIYGATDYDKETSDTLNPEHLDPNREGFFVAAKVAYKLPIFTPSISYFYGSGNKTNYRTNGGGIMPSLGGSYSPLLYAFDASALDINTYNALGGAQSASMQGVALEVKDLTFLKGLTHTVQLGYLTGTSSAGTLTGANNSVTFDPYRMTTSDHFVAFNFVTSYQIYENLTTTFALGYIHTIDSNAKYTKLEDDNLAVGVGFAYSF